MLNIEAISALFAKLGFPMAVAIWALYRMDQLMLSWIENQGKVAHLLETHSVMLTQLLQQMQR